MPGIAYLDFDLLVQHVGDSYRAQVVNSPSGQAAATFTLPFSDLELENFFLRVGRARLGVRRVDSPEVNAAKSCGERLFSAVFQGDVLGCFRSSLDEAARRGEGLRIRLRLTDAPELADLPWEYLYNPTLNRFLALSVETPFVRYLDLAERIRPLPVSTPLRALVMISSPKDYPQLDVEREWSNLRKALSDWEERGLLALERLDDATLASLQRRLRRGEYHIFHFIGHGGFDQRSQDGLLILEDGNGRGRAVSGQDLGMLLHDHRSMRLSILNACEGARASRSDPFSGTAQSLVQQGIPAVIAMQFEITDEAAITFAHEFYGAVADGYPVDASLAEARKAIFAQGNGLEWGTPVLYLRSPDGRIFERQDSRKEVIQKAERLGEAPTEPASATPRISRRSASRIEERFRHLRPKWRLAGMGLLLLAILAGGTMWIRNNWGMSETIPPEAPPSAPQMVSLKIQADKQKVKVDESMALKVRGIYPSGKTDELSEGIEWQSSDPSVATVDAAGRVQGRKEGKAEITAQYAGMASDPWTVSVKGEERRPPAPPPVRLVSLKVEAEKRELQIAERTVLKATGKYSDGKQGEIPQGVEWHSSNRTIAAVDSAGRVVGRNAGKVDITAKYAGVVSSPVTLSIKEGRKRVPPTPAVPVERIEEHLKRARFYRERGDYNRALSQLRKAKSLNPGDQRIQEEIAITERACNAEKKLGREDLTCG